MAGTKLTLATASGGDYTAPTFSFSVQVLVWRFGVKIEDEPIWIGICIPIFLLQQMRFDMI